MGQVWASTNVAVTGNSYRTADNVEFVDHGTSTGVVVEDNTSLEPVALGPGRSRSAPSSHRRGRHDRRGRRRHGDGLRRRHRGRPGLLLRGRHPVGPLRCRPAHLPLRPGRPHARRRTSCRPWRSTWAGTSGPRSSVTVVVAGQVPAPSRRCRLLLRGGGVAGPGGGTTPCSPSATAVPPVDGVLVIHRPRRGPVLLPSLGVPDGRLEDQRTDGRRARRRGTSSPSWTSPTRPRPPQGTTKRTTVASIAALVEVEASDLTIPRVLRLEEGAHVDHGKFWPDGRDVHRRPRHVHVGRLGDLSRRRVPDLRRLRRRPRPALGLRRRRARPATSWARPGPSRSAASTSPGRRSGSTSPSAGTATGSPSASTASSTGWPRSPGPRRAVDVGQRRRRQPLRRRLGPLQRVLRPRLHPRLRAGQPPVRRLQGPVHPRAAPVALHPGGRPLRLLLRLRRRQRHGLHRLVPRRLRDRRSSDLFHHGRGKNAVLAEAYAPGHRDRDHPAAGRGCRLPLRPSGRRLSRPGRGRADPRDAARRLPGRTTPSGGRTRPSRTRPARPWGARRPARSGRSPGRRPGSPGPARRRWARSASSGARRSAPRTAGPSTGCPWGRRTTTSGPGGPCWPATAARSGVAFRVVDGANFWAAYYDAADFLTTHGDHPGPRDHLLGQGRRRGPHERRRGHRGHGRRLGHPPRHRGRRVRSPSTADRGTPGPRSRSSPTAPTPPARVAGSAT